MSEPNEPQKSLDRKVYAIACRPDLYEIISAEAKSRGMSRSHLVRLAVERWLKRSSARKETRPHD